MGHGPWGSFTFENDKDVAMNTPLETGKRPAAKLWIPLPHFTILIIIRDRCKILCIRSWFKLCLLSYQGGFRNLLSIPKEKYDLVLEVKFY
jgi:hypothetical protein